MSELKYRPATPVHPECWYDGDHVYRRAVIGMAWPYGDQEGALCLLVEQRDIVSNNDRRMVRLVREYGDSSVSELVRVAHRWCLDYHVRAVATPRSDRAIGIIEDYNDYVRKLRQPTVNANTPPQYERYCFRNYMRLLHRRIRDEKTLFFGGCARTRDAVAVVVANDLERPLEEYPRAASLLYALADLDLSGTAADWSRDKQRGDPLTGY